MTITYYPERIRRIGWFGSAGLRGARDGAALDRVRSYRDRLGLLAGVASRMGRVVTSVGYGVCTGSWAKLYRNVIPRIGDAPLFALSGQTQLTRAYNKILDAYAPDDLDAVILLHDDLEITDPDAETKFLKALTDPDVALVGVCGGKGDQTLAWWTSETIGHQMTDSGMVDFGPRTGDVAFIEGSIMVFSPWAVRNLRFDTRYLGFLGYDDICLTARAAGKQVTVVDVDTHHHSTVGFKSAEIAAAWDVAEEIFQEKWWGQ